MRAAFLMLVVAACSGADTVREETLGTVAFDVPGEWQRDTVERRFGQQAEWRPTSNDRHEALTIVRSEQSPQIARADRDYLGKLLVQAQLSLPGARATQVSPIVTTKGLAGLRLSVAFVPPGEKTVYHRVHVLLVDGDALISVLYTARDPEHRTLDLVLETIHHEEG
jgi:hypothetical protein